MQAVRVQELAISLHELREVAESDVAPAELDRPLVQEELHLRAFGVVGAAEK